MNCPSCAQPIAPSRSRCPFCGLVLIPPVEGSLAPEPKLTTPPARSVRTVLPGKERDKNWREEVRRRVQRRRRSRGRAPGDVFDDDAGDDENKPSATMEPDSLASEPSPMSPVPVAQQDAENRAQGDFPLRSSDELALYPDAEEQREKDESSMGIDWAIGEPSPESRPLERPATAPERFKAALFDAGFLAGLWSVVVYFAAKAARTPIQGLWTTWLPLVSYLGFLGIMYATYFTGTTGCTPGKAFLGLKVVDTAGRPPTYARAFIRAVLGSAGILLGFIGLVPVFLDPARRSLHDQLLKTRVIKR